MSKNDKFPQQLGIECHHKPPLYLNFSDSLCPADP